MGESRSSSSGRYSRVGVAKATAHKATWEEADAEALWRTIYQVTNVGDALTFGKTRDGGAVVLTILSQDSRVKEYATGPEEIAILLADVRASVEDDE